MKEFNLWEETRQKIHRDVVGDSDTAELTSQQLFDLIDRTAIAVHQSIGNLENRINSLEESQRKRERDERTMALRLR